MCVIIASNKQNKTWRQSQDWYSTGKKNECEIYQINLINKIVNTKVETKTNLRFNICDNTLQCVKSPNKLDNGFEFTEDIDGILEHNETKYYFNIKMICDKGGAQTRSLREVYHFIMCQLEYLLNNPNDKCYFINILDGDESYKNMAKFTYLVNKDKYSLVKDKIIIGDMLSFNQWWNTRK